MDPVTAFFLALAEGFKLANLVIERTPLDVSADQQRVMWKIVSGIIDAFDKPFHPTPAGTVPKKTTRVVTKTRAGSRRKMSYEPAVSNR